MGMQGWSWSTPRSRQKPEVPRMTCLRARGVPVQMAGCRGSAARRRAEARFGVRANICVQRSAGRVPAIAVSAAPAGRR